MVARFPDSRRHDDGRFEAGDVVALAGHGVPPEFLDVALEFRAERAVIPKTVDAAVNLGGLKHKPAPLAQRHDFFHERIFFWLGHIFTFRVQSSAFRVLTLNSEPQTLNDDWV